MRRRSTAAITWVRWALIALSVTGCGANAPTKRLRVNSLRPLQRTVAGEIVTASALMPSGELIAGTSAGHVYALARESRDNSPRLLVSLSGKIMAVAVSRDGTMSGAVSVDGGAAVGRTAGQVLKGGLSTSPASITFSPTGHQVAFGGFGVKTFDAATGAKTGDYAQPVGSGGRGTYGAIAFAGSHLLVAASVDGVDRWRIGSRDPTGATLSCSCGADGVGLSGDGRRAVFGTADGHMVIMDTTSRRVIADVTVSTNVEDHVYAVAADQSGRLVFGFSGSGTSAAWDGGKRRVVWRRNLSGLSPSRADFVGYNEVLLQSQTTDGGSGTGFGLAPWVLPLSR